MMSDSGLSDGNLIEQIANVHAHKTKFEHLSHNVTDDKKLQEGLKQLYRSIMENAHVAITLIDLDYKILIANRTIGEKFNKPISELIGRECFREFEKREAICPHCPGKQAIATGQPAEAEAEGIRDDGSRFSVRIQAFPATDSNGAVMGFIEVIEDITERKKAEQALRQSEEKYRSLYESVHAGVILQLVNGEITHANKVASQIFGMTTGQIIGKTSIDPVWHMITEDGTPVPGEDHPSMITIRTGEPVRDAVRGLFAEDPENIRWLNINTEPLLDPATGKVEKVMITFHDITDRKKAEEALRESKNSYRAVVENAIEGIVVVQGQTLQFVNPSLVSMIGYSEKELLTRPFIEFIHPDHREWAMGIHIKRLKGEEVPPIYELKVVDKKGNTRWLENNGILIKWHNEPATLNFLKDITGRKKAEEILKYRMEFERLITMLSKRFIDPGDIDEKIKEALKSIGEFAGVDRAYVFQLRDDGRTADNTHEWCADGIKPQVENLKGITLDDALPWFWEKVRAHETFHVPVVADLPPEAHLEKAHFEMQQIQALVVIPMLSKGVLKGFLGFDSVRAQKTWAEDIITLLRITGENISLALDREHAEQRARLLSSTVEQSSEGMAVGDLQGNILFLNNAFAAMHGYTPEELIGRHLTILHTPEQMPSVEAANRQLKETGKFDGEIWHVHRDGTVFPCLMRNSLLRDEAGNPIGLIGALRDITESKRAEQALKESEIKFRSITEESLVGVYVIQDGEFKYVNPKFAEIFGYSVDELIDKKGLDELVFPEDWPTVKENLRKRIAGELRSVQYGFRGITKGKEVIHVEVYGSATEYQGRPAVIGTLLGITERKQAQEALQESEERFRAIYENALIGLYRTTPDGRILMANPAIIQMLGYSSFEELAQLNLEEEGFSLEYSRLDFKQLIEADGQVIGLESGWLKRDGTTLFVRESAKAIRNKEGKTLYYEGTIEDITDRKRADEALRESKERFHHAFDNANVGMCLVDINGSIMKVNNQMCEIFGYESEELQRMNVNDIAHPEDIDISHDFIKRTVSGEIESGKFEKRYIHRDGRIVWGQVSSSLVRDSNGEPLYFISHVQDITECKRVGEALSISELQYRTTLNSMRDAIHVVDADLKVILMNDRFKQWTEELGIKIHRPIGRKIKDVFPFLSDKICDEYHQVFDSGKILTTEEMIEIADKRFVTETRKIPIYESGRVVRVVTVVRDITERRQAERVRVNHLRFLESLDQVNQAIQGAGDIDQMMGNVLDAVLTIFSCDRAWLLYPCDPEAPSWRVPMERTVPEYPGALAVDVDVTMDQGVAGVLRTVLASDGPVKFGPESGHPLPKESAKQFGFKSQISMAIHPKIGDPWMFGLHQCSRQRLWTEEEEKLLQEIGRRIADAMSSLLTLRGLRESRERYRALVDNANLGIALINTDFEVLMSNAAQGRMIQKDHRDFIGGKCHYEFEKRDEVCPHCPGRQAMESGHTHEVETEGVRIDGTKISVRVQASPVYEEDGRVRGFVEIVEDITDRKRAEEALLEREELFKATLESTADGILVVNDKGQVTHSNARMIQMWRISDELFETGEDMKLLPFAAEQLVDPEDFLSKVEDLYESSKDDFGTLVFKDGRVFERYSCPLIRDGKNVGRVWSFRDITERKRAEEALRESEEKFRSLAEQSPNMIFINKNRRVVYANNMCEDVMGYKREELCSPDFNFLDLIAPESVDLINKNFAKHSRGEDVQPYDYSLINKQGERIEVINASKLIHYEGEMAILGIVTDISDRKQAEQKLLEDRAQLKSLASQLSLTEERERREIATELHDRIGQSLVISKIKLDQLRKSVSSDELTETLGEICDCLEQVIQDTRTLTFDLSSPILYELGFEAAVAEWLNEQIQEKYGIKTEFEDDQQPKALDDDIRVLLFRNVRELLINAVKHSNARNVKVSVSRADERMIVRVEDDGVGFDPAEVASKAAERARFGLFSIRERLEQLEGHLEIKSEPGRGSRITMTAPLKCENIVDEAQV